MNHVLEQLGVLHLHLIALGCAVGGVVVGAVGWRRERHADLDASGVTDKRLATVWRAVIRPLSRALRPNAKDFDEVHLSLQRAGRRDRSEVDRFAEERALGILLGLAIGSLLSWAIGGRFGGFVFLAAFTFGLVWPKMRLASKTDERKDAINRALPAAIDLLMTCVDAGLSIEQAMARVAREYAPSSPVLAEEFMIAAGECEAGVALTETLRRLARRVDVDDMSGLCSIIAQAHELGAPIVDTLQEYADSARKLRMATLEERAGKLATKLIFPLALFLLPSAMVAILGPAAIQLMHSLK